MCILTPYKYFRESEISVILVTEMRKDTKICKCHTTCKAKVTVAFALLSGAVLQTNGLMFLWGSTLKVRPQVGLTQDWSRTYPLTSTYAILFTGQVIKIEILFSSL